MNRFTVSKEFKENRILAWDNLIKRIEKYAVDDYSVKVVSLDNITTKSRAVSVKKGIRKRFSSYREHSNNHVRPIEPSCEKDSETENKDYLTIFIDEALRKLKHNSDNDENLNILINNLTGSNKTESDNVYCNRFVLNDITEKINEKTNITDDLQIDLNEIKKVDRSKGSNDRTAINKKKLTFKIDDDSEEETVSDASLLLSTFQQNKKAEIKSICTILTDLGDCDTEKCSNLGVLSSRQKANINIEENNKNKRTSSSQLENMKKINENMSIKANSPETNDNTTEIEQLARTNYKNTVDKSRLQENTTNFLKADKFEEENCKVFHFRFNKTANNIKKSAKSKRHTVHSNQDRERQINTQIASGANHETGDIVLNNNENETQMDISVKNKCYSHIELNDSKNGVLKKRKFFILDEDRGQVEQTNKKPFPETMYRNPKNANDLEDSAEEFCLKISAKKFERDQQKTNTKRLTLDDFYKDEIL